ncbi:MAG: hypothetical protein QNK23_18815 [Crocinitomicaceae bacterium]|nr:hypothetical protein [Crocinitomicaceae bacterium]
MKSLLLYFCILSSFTFSQSDQDYYTEECNLDDTIIDLSLRCYAPLGKIYTSGCTYIHDDGHWFKNEENQDSILKKLRSILSPVIGRLAANRTIITETEYYNLDGVKRIASIMEGIEEEDPYYLKLGYSFQCYVLLEDSIWFPFEVILDKRHRILDKTTLPQCLKTLDAFKLKSLSEIYNKVRKDPYMKDLGIDSYIQLRYSAGFNLFYYELDAEDGEVISSSSGYRHYRDKHFLIDAQTGKVLWRTWVDHYVEQSGCVIDHLIEYPVNTLIER